MTTQLAFSSQVSSLQLTWPSPPAPASPPEPPPETPEPPAPASPPASPLEPAVPADPPLPEDPSLPPDPPFPDDPPLPADAPTPSPPKPASFPSSRLSSFSPSPHAATIRAQAPNCQSRSSCLNELVCIPGVARRDFMSTGPLRFGGDTNDSPSTTFRGDREFSTRFACSRRQCELPVYSPSLLTAGAPLA